MDPAAWTSLIADPDFKQLTLPDRRQVVADINSGRKQWPPPPTQAKRPSPQDATDIRMTAPDEVSMTARPPTGEAPSVPGTPAPGPGGPYIPTDVGQTDPMSGAPMTAPDPRQIQAQTESDYLNPRTIGQRVGDRLGPIPQAVVEGALPTAGGLLGGLVAGGPTVGLAGLPGLSVGSAVGELGNQALGITEPSPTSVLTAAATPAVGLGITRVGQGLYGGGKRLIQALPGVWQRGQDKAFQSLFEGVGEHLPSAEDVATAYQTARGLLPTAPPIPFSRMSQAIQDWMPTRPPAHLGAEELNTVAKRVETAMTQTKNVIEHPGVTFHDIVNQMDNVGRMISEVGKKAGTGPLRHMWSEGVKDLEEVAATHPAAAAVREAATTFKQRIGMLDIDAAIEKASQMRPGVAAMRIIQKAVDDTRENFTAPVAAALKDLVTQFGERPDRPIGELTSMAASALGYATGPTTGLLMLAPRAVTEGLRYTPKALNSATSTLLGLAYHAARRFGTNAMTPAGGSPDIGNPSP